MTHGKLVRDEIPRIIRESGKEPIIRFADDKEYDELLRDKLVEEVQEFLDSESDPGELADIMEVLLALARRVGLTSQQLDELRLEKSAVRGGFDKGVVWLGNRSADIPPTS